MMDMFPALEQGRVEWAAQINTLVLVQAIESFWGLVSYKTASIMGYSDC